MEDPLAGKRFMGLQIYNTLTRKKEEFETIEPGTVRMYVCGPTVYDSAHIGHAMFILVFDVFRRYLEYRGYNVRMVMNYTDVDDKIILRAREAGEDPVDLAERYISEFKSHLDELNVLPAAATPRATEVIETIIEMIASLIERGFAYQSGGDVYFRVARDDDYGKLSGRKLEDMIAGARVDINERKEDPLDFALWKAAKPGEPFWDSPWGNGRPGWHIECSAMNMKFLGSQIDIHGGGNDLIFPHHENEIAQTESLTGEPMARYWAHNGMLQLSGEKMSKSIGNLITVDDFLSRHEADALRIMVLNSGYRRPLQYSEEIVLQAERALERLRNALRPAQVEAADDRPNEPRGNVETLKDQTEAAREGFLKAMDDDFNTAGALGHIFDLVRAINHARDARAREEDLRPAQDAVREL
ncbi:MAG TPA: cysteine--tRNA ligase, partial [Anaerolineales bacterium]|nr:cysteine--tRNA ligase [Anaerolineales bacterium]